MELSTYRYQLTNSIAVTVKGDGFSYNVDLDSKQERLAMVMNLLDVACDVLSRDASDDEELDMLRDKLIDCMTI